MEARNKKTIIKPEEMESQKKDPVHDAIVKSLSNPHNLAEVVCRDNGISSTQNNPSCLYYPKKDPVHDAIVKSLSNPSKLAEVVRRDNVEDTVCNKH